MMRALIGQITLGSILTLASASFAEAQYKAGKLAFINQSEHDVNVTSVTMFGEDGKKYTPKLSWKIGANRSLYLQNKEGKKIYISSMEFYVTTPLGSTLWHTDASDFDKDGDLTIVFNQEMINRHNSIILEQIQSKLNRLEIQREACTAAIATYKSQYEMWKSQDGIPAHVQSMSAMASMMAKQKELSKIDQNIHATTGMLERLADQ